MIRSGIISQQNGSAPLSPESFAARQKSTVPLSPYGFYEYLPEGYDQAPAESLPLIVFLHGSDERGNGNSELNKVLAWGMPKQQNAGTWHHNFIGLSPQWLGANDDNYYAPQDLMDFIDYAKDTYKVDPERVYLTGVSAGTWFLMYYLQNFPTTHGIAASVILSGNAYVGYTDPAVIATAESPIWLMSNIGDPLVPWDDTFPPIQDYIPVVDTRDQINAVTPGMVEKLTGFVSTSHTDKWDGIYDSSLIGTADGDYDPFDEPVYDWLLEHSLSPPARVFNIGTGSGQVIIDGSNPLFTGGLQDGDEIIVNSGNYTMSWPYNGLLIRNINLDSGYVKITAEDGTSFEGIDIGHTTSVKGVDLDFTGKDVTLTVGGSQGYIDIDKGLIGGFENIKIHGVTIPISSESDRGIEHRGASVPYDNGTGPIAIKNLEIYDITFTGVGESNYRVISIGGVLETDGSTVVDQGYCEDIHVHNISFDSTVNTSSHVQITNTKNFDVHNIYFEGVNQDDPSVAVYHWRLIYCKGQGKIHDCYARNSGGCVAAIEMYAREPDQVCNIYNVYSYNSWRYGTTEFRSHSYSVGVPYAYACEAEADYISYFRVVDNPSDIYNATCVDNYSDLGLTVDVRNSYSVRPNGVSSIINNGSAGISSNNIIDTDNVDFKINEITMIPASDSILKGAGINRPNITTDLNGLARLNPPTIGACEAE